MSRADFNEGTEYVIDIGDGNETEWRFKPGDYSDGMTIEYSTFDDSPENMMPHIAEVAISVPTLIDWLRRSGRLT